MGVLDEIGWYIFLQSFLLTVFSKKDATKLDYSMLEK